MPRYWKIFAAIGVLLILWVGRFVWDYFDPGSIAHIAMQEQLKLFGSAMYDYHSQTGRWPASLDDLAQTSLPQRSYVWRQSATALVLLWPKNLKPNPKENANVLLAYHHGGLFNKFGRVWVLWGDLRTERLPVEELRQRQNSPAP